MTKENNDQIELIESASNGATKIKCLHCGDVIYSRNRHDFRWCSCHSVAVDGGSDYLRMAHAENAQYTTDLTESLVGPRDKTNDKQWCHSCEQLVLESATEQREVEVHYGFDTVPRTKEMRHFCVPACKPLEK